VRLSGSEPSCLDHRSDQFIIESEHLVEQLTVLDVVTLLVTVELHGVCYHLLLAYIFKNQELRLVLIVIVTTGRSAVCLIKEALVATVRAAHRRVHCSVRNVG